MSDNSNNNQNDILYEPVHKLLNYSIHMFETDPKEKMFIKYWIEGKMYNITIHVEEDNEIPEGATLQ